MSDPSDSTAAAPLLPGGGEEEAAAPQGTSRTPVSGSREAGLDVVNETQGGGASGSVRQVPTSATPSTIGQVLESAPLGTTLVVTPTSAAQGVSAPPSEYKFVHHRLLERVSSKRFLLPILLITFEIAFVVVFAVFGTHTSQSDKHVQREYHMFSDVHTIAVLGFGFIMAFLKRYGYSSVSFNLLLVAFSIQLALIVRGLFEWTFDHNVSFKIGLDNLLYADMTTIAVLVAFGAVLGKTTLAQLVVLAFVCVITQCLNECINVNLIQAHDVGRSIYVHLFGAAFGLAAAKFLNFHSVRSSKQATVYHSDMFALIGTLFLFAFYPSFNALLAAKDSVDPALSQERAIVNTFAAICASCVITFATSSLVSNGKLNVFHVQHATLAGGIAIGSVADLNVPIYVSLIVGSLAGLISTLGFQYIDPFLNRCLKIHDTSSVMTLSLLPGLLAGLLSAMYASVADYSTYGRSLYTIYPGRAAAVFNTTLPDVRVINHTAPIDPARSALGQAGYQLAAVAITIVIANVAGALTGIVLRMPVFEQLSPEEEMFDDEVQWLTPSDYALKLTFAPTGEKVGKELDEGKQKAEPSVEAPTTSGGGGGGGGLENPLASKTDSPVAEV